MTESFTDRVKQLQLPLDKSIIIGSGLLDQLGIRPADDIDVVVTPEVFYSLAEKPWWRHGLKQDGLEYYAHELRAAEVLSCWSFRGRVLNYEDLKMHSVVYDNVRFIDLAFLRRWKEWAGREKDLRDVALIDQYSKEIA